MSEPENKRRKFSKRDKKVTAHAKAVPLKALEKHHSGPIQIKFLEDKAKRSKVMSTRKETLFGKARELEILTGAKVKVHVSYLGITDVYETESKATDEQQPTTSQGDVGVLDKPCLSPRAQIEPEVQVDEGYEVHEVELVETGVQVSMGEKITELPGVDRQCSICGADYNNDTVDQQKLWIGCDTKECKYWVHANCMLGTKKVLKRAFVSKIPFNCPMHR